MVDGMTHCIQIFILTDDLTKAAQWRQHLSSSNTVITTAPPKLPRQSVLDLVVTDRSVVGDALSAHSSQLVQGDVGVIAIGSGGPADVTLSSDVTGRELKLAVQLMAEIVQLRRERRSGTEIRKILTHLALSDPLTGSPNRRAWDDELRSRTVGGVDGSRRVCLALIDVDHFKSINDQYGHATGDTVLKSIAEVLKVNVREQDFVARLGGDEFGILFDGLDETSSGPVVERIRMACSDERHPYVDHLTVSAGFAIRNRDQGRRELYQAADKALRNAKARGRDRTEVANSGSSRDSPTGIEEPDHGGKESQI